MPDNDVMLDIKEKISFPDGTLDVDGLANYLAELDEAR